MKRLGLTLYDALAHTVEALAELNGMVSWVQNYRRLKWQFAGRVARQTDDRWSTTLLDWRPFTGQGRYQGRPRTRWADPIVALAGGSWTEIAADESMWTALEDGFVSKAFLD